MKILELRLTAFGPFRGRNLDLRAGNHGLHVIFGPNEAGKSSALRALHALLYGIPTQTNDAFLHSYDALRIGGWLRHSDGTEINFVRRKGSKNTLLSPDGTWLNDHALDRFLGGVGPEPFGMFWGIDHGRLVQGGREILDGKGDLGESLFAAGSGAAHLRALRKNLEEEAETFFKPAGRSLPFNQAVKHLKELRDAEKKATVSASEWMRLDADEKEADKRVTTLAGQIQYLGREKSRLERLKRVLPLLAEREETHRRLADLGDVVPLATDFPKRRQDAETALYLAEQHLKRLTEALQGQAQIVTNLGETPPLVAEADAVNGFYKYLGIHRRARIDRPKLDLQRSEQRTRATHLLADLRPDLGIDAAETLQPFVSRRTTIQKLAGERAGLDERVTSARSLNKKAQEQSDALAREAASLPPQRNAESLDAVIKAVRRRGDAEAEQEKADQSIKRMVVQRDAALENLRLPASGIYRLKEIHVPTAATIADFEQKAKDLDQATRAAKAEDERRIKKTRELDAKIETLRTQKAVPTEADLAEVRTRRDRAFDLLRDRWENDRDVVAEARELLGEGNLIDRYPHTVSEADAVVDRLRSEADRVAELAQALEERQCLGREMEDGDADSLRRKKDVDELNAAWRGEWPSVPTVPPKIHDARAWGADFGRLLEQSEAIVAGQQAQKEVALWIEKQTASLRNAITTLEPVRSYVDGLAVMLEVADRLRQRIEAENHARNEHVRRTKENVQATIDTVGAMREAQTEIDCCQQKWIDATRGLLLNDAAPPDDVLGAIESVEKILKALDDAAGLEVRIAGIDRDAESFRANVLALAGRLGEMSAIEGGHEDSWVEEIQRRLTTALQEDEQRRHILTQIQRLQTEIAGYEYAPTNARITLMALREEARCWETGDLVVAEQRSAELGKLNGDLAQIEKNLVLSGDGASISALEAEAASTDKDVIGVRLEQIGAELQVVNGALSEAQNARATAQAERMRLQLSSAASEKAEEVQSTLARLRDGVIQYARLRVASTLLSRRIDDYRRENQTPLLRRAGMLFQEMTLQRFERLDADLDEDRPILVGVRPDGTRVPSHGMSEGTRDQLFFALRLAAVEASCATSESMPFVVDDVLVQFDDDRSAAGLRVLADVATRTQVVLFTHHRQVRTCAEALAASGVVVHEL